MFCTAALGLAVFSVWPASTVLAGDNDGSGSNNPDMLRSSYPVEWVPVDGIEVSSSPEEPGSLPGDLDWSLGLRGAYERDDDGTHYETLILPSVSLTQQWRRAQIKSSLDGEIDKLDSDKIRLANLRAAIAADYRFDELTTFTGNAQLQVSQESTLTAPLDQAEPPVIVSGSLDGTVTRDLGRFDLELRGGFGRESYGDTTLTDGTVIDNDDSSNTFASTGLRLGLKMTPVFTIFGDANAERSVFDGVSPDLGTKADGTDYALKAGLSGNWGHDRLQAEVSVGVGLRHYDADSLDDVRTTLYDASISYKPDDSWTFGASLSTAIVPPGGGVDETEVSYTAEADVGYKVNPWLALRADANWSRSDRLDSGIVDNSYGWGAGADYALNAHTDLSADYAFSHIENDPDPERDAHRITLGLTFKR